MVALLIALAGVLVAGALDRTGDQTMAALAPDATAANVDELAEIVEMQEVTGATEAGQMTPESRPPPELSPGWPFEQLPPVTKWEEPVPEIALARTHFPVEPQPVHLLGPTEPLMRELPPVWLLAPLAAAASAGGAKHVTTVPEPSTLPLMAAGLLLLALHALFGRGGRRSSRRQHDR